MSITKADATRDLPPHPPPDMLNLYMTRYDYDYNREIQSAGVFGKDETASVSGDVRNRPIFRFGQPLKGCYGTTYREDYVKYDRGVKDLPALLRTACGEHDATSSFVRFHYSPSLTKEDDKDGSKPNTTYKTDYTLSGSVPKGEPFLYAGARTTAVNPDFFFIPVTEEALEAEKELPPKITSKESLLLKAKPSADGYSSRADGLMASRRPQLTVGGPPTEYSCTSWVYGDKSLAFPSQLPRGIEDSPNAHLIGTMDDKAALLALLAGKKKPVGSGKPFPILDDTNPVFIHKREQPYCGVTRRVENEGHVKMSIYKSDYINQGMLPELPDAVALSGMESGQAPGERRLACAGEMLAGSLARHTAKLCSLRNSHGNLLKEKPDPKVVDLQTWRQMLAIEKRISVDKADPHRHKLQVKP